MKILHIFPNEKFTVDFVTRVNQLFTPQEHVFYIISNGNKICSAKDLPYDNVIFSEIHEDLTRFTELYKSSDRVILHSLFISYQGKCDILKLMKTTSIPVIWDVWGGDLYDTYRKAHNSLNPKLILSETVRKQIIARLHGAIATGDYKELRKLYKTEAKQYIAPYSYQFIEPQECEKEDDLLNVMVGHSATETCRHLEAFEKLARYKDKIRVYCPLSYPKDQAYIDKVSERGRALFGDHFVAMTDFMPFSEYVKFLNAVDIGVFNNDRQQGNGNIANLLYLGKKVYISPENNLLELYTGEGAVMMDVNAIEDPDFLELFPAEIREQNHQAVAGRYSDERFLKNWTEVFKG